MAATNWVMAVPIFDFTRFFVGFIYLAGRANACPEPDEG
jgi:hypothetical protein